MDMPPARAELTLSITFDTSVFLDLGSGPWPPCASREETVTASRWVFHRQTGPKGAVVNVDDADGRRAYEELAARGDQVVIPISGRSRAPNGVYVAGGILYDDLGGRAEAITDLPVTGEAHAAKTPLLAASVYAAAVMMDIPKHAAMASLRSFFAV
jgi:UDP-N-acetylmuramoylalanine--D-glutamate ligase